MKTVSCYELHLEGIVLARFWFKQNLYYNHTFFCLLVVIFINNINIFMNMVDCETRPYNLNQFLATPPTWYNQRPKYSIFWRAQPCICRAQNKAAAVKSSSSLNLETKKLTYKCTRGERFAIWAIELVCSNPIQGLLTIQLNKHVSLDILDILAMLSCTLDH